MTEKACSVCREVKSLSDFPIHTKEKDGRYCQCSVCARAARKADYQRNREKRIAQAVEWRKSHPRNVETARAYARNNRQRERNNRLKREYGITLAQYDEMFLRQGGVCAICENTSAANFHVDHDHKTGKVRGLLCNACNKALGFVKDDLNIIEKMKRYLNGNS